MKEVKYKTNINCNGCIATVTPHLEKIQGIEHWEVDIKDKEKILTIRGEQLDKQAVENAVKEAGFSIEPKKKKWF
jgi:copper chaperone CopZ